MGSSLVGDVRGLFAIANVHTDGTYLLNRGFIPTGTEHISTGVYVLTMQNAASIVDDIVVLANPLKSQDSPPVTIPYITVSQTLTQFNNGQFQVNIFNGANGAALDSQFGVQVQDVSPN